VAHERVGLIGFGIMGAAMADRLLAAGHEVTAFDVSETAMARARALGCATDGSPADVARSANAILISLPRPEHVTAVVRVGGDSILAGARSGSVIVDTSTVDAATSQANAGSAGERSVGYLDCPILGRPAGVGNWTLPVGGDPAHLARVEPLLLTFAARVVHVGPSGHGNILKLLNNLMFGAINAATCEVFALAERLGMEPALVFDTIVDSGAATVSNLFRELGPKIVNADYEPNFSIDNLEKDIGLGLAMADASQTELPLSKAGQRLNQRAQEAGLGDQDTAAVVKIVRAGATTTELA
jgi:3-hydroxyisobutyrate dehydrogenase-like beta-hydroxyacid dehydrogenase